MAAVSAAISVLGFVGDLDVVDCLFATADALGLAEVFTALFIGADFSLDAETSVAALFAIITLGAFAALFAGFATVTGNSSLGTHEHR